MLLTNKYSRVYYAIIGRATPRGLDRSLVEGYHEKHHILPRSLAGTDTAENLVLLTAKEHYVCHHLLVKMTSGTAHEKMKHAFAFMCNAASRTQLRQTAVQYKSKRELAATRSDEWRTNISISRKGYKEPDHVVEAKRQRLTGRTLSDSHRENIRKASKRRGVSAQARAARLQTLVKTYAVTFPDGTVEMVTNLKQWCLNRGFNHGSAANNCRHSKTIRSGPLLGYKFDRCT